MSTWQIERRDVKIELAGELCLTDAAAIWTTLKRLATPPADHLDLDLHAVVLVDGAVLSLVVELRASLVARGTRSEIVDVPTRLLPLVHLYRGDRPPIRDVPVTREHGLAKLGAATERAATRLRGVIEFAGELVAASAAIVRRPRRVNWRSIPSLIERAGADGVPIVLLLNFLLGFVMAFQATRQLELYGANLYVADIVGVSMTRELAPLITAIIIAGRSGAAFAAELGTMRVSEEIDALRTLGLAPLPYLVVPRIWALAVIAPVLTLLGDVSGVLGGLVVGMTSLDVSPHAYLAELRNAVVMSDVWTGLVKSVAFGGAIAFIGCQQGLATHGDASAVGRGTTTTVVACLFTVVVIDTLFTLLFRGIAV